MNHDLSLSQSLGGLRIANPDAEPASPTTSSPSPLPSSSRSSNSTVTGSRQPNLLPALSTHGFEDSHSLDFDPSSFTMQTPVSSSVPTASPLGKSIGQIQPGSDPRSSISDQSTGLQRSNSSRYHSQMRNLALQQQTAAMRPTSGMYNQPNDSASSGVSAHGAPRYRDDLTSSDSSTGGIARTRSQRRYVENSAGGESPRVYRQPSTHVAGGNGPLPPRRNSRRSRAATGGSNTAISLHDSADQGYAGSSAAPSSAEEWRERGAAVSTRKETDASGQTRTRLVKKGVKDFTFGRTLGEGSYSTVLAATDRQTLKEYAVKVLDKRHIIKEKKVKYVNIERDTLNRLTDHPGIVRLYYTFQDERSLYFVLDLASSGELLGVLKRTGTFDMDCARFYGAEILDSIAYMHSRGVIHRDLKPENVLLDRDMHVKITDFGTAKILEEPKPPRKNSAGPDLYGDPTDGAETDRAVSFVGTAEYVSPELLREKNACKASDLWAFGCIIFQLIAGRPPFKAANEYLTFQKILALDYNFPDSFPEVARDLVERLLVLDPARRLPVEHIKNHRFFEGIQWGRGLWRQKAPRLRAFVPPPPEPLKLTTNGRGGDNSAAIAAASAMASSAPSPIGTSQPQAPPTRRPQLQNVTELAPPSQLDIEWSPVLKHDNERILKLGNLVVLSAPQPHSPNNKNADAQSTNEKPKFSRFFSSNGIKKRERLVLITSRARLVVAAAGGNEKKAKLDLNLAANEATCRSATDAKGLTYWSIDTRDKYYSFEDPRATTSDPAGSKFSSQEWLEAIEQARELASVASMANSYSGESMYNDMNAGTSGFSSPMESPRPDYAGGQLSAGPSAPGQGERHVLRNTLRRPPTEEENMKGRRRFSKRHSKSGLAAVF